MFKAALVTDRIIVRKEWSELALVNKDSMLGMTETYVYS